TAYAVRRDYQTDYPKPNWSEQDPSVIMRALIDGVKELLTQVRPSDIACIGLSGTMNGLIAVDNGASALYPNIIHSDSRAWREVNIIREHISPEDFYRLTGNRLDHHFTLPKILWMRQNRPDIYKKARWWLNTKDYIYAHLTGNVGFTDYSDASLTIAMDIMKKRWSEDLLKSLGLDVAKMPQIRKGSDVSGRVTKNIAEMTGLLEGTPVAMGGGDGACAARGAGLWAPGGGYCCIGSSAWVSQLTDEPLLDSQMRIFNYLDMDGEVNHTLGVIQTGAAAYDWAAENLLSGGDDGGTDYSKIENMARQIAPGAEGVMFLPTLMGERTPYWDANTRGCLTGFTLYHDQRHVARAVYEGVAFALNNVVEIMAECSKPINSMMLIGGGSRSGLWPDMLASVFGIPTRVHMSPGEATSLGAAITAGVGAGLFESYEKAAQIVRERSNHPVNELAHEQYKKAFDVYKRIYSRMKPLFDQMAEMSGT
ncbi:MAG: FGGY family carbohydrate kinase, partial [Clostridia bacterium]|nr:FGGY family carbohydrate kinase [Clostridia bacterium]